MLTVLTALTATVALSALTLLTTLGALSGCADSAQTPGGFKKETRGGIASDISGFTAYFIDVGQADSSLVVCDGETMLIDGGNVDDSDLIYSFLEKHGVERLDYAVATHAHEDHVGGLAGALNYAEVGVAYSPVKEYDSRAFENFTEYLEKQNVKITAPEPGASFELGGALVEILAPVREYDEPNDSSIVLKITYGKTSFLFTGDAERASEQDMLEQGYDLSSTVLKVGHHGSETSTTYPFLREVMPKFAIVSCGADNDYGHPHADLLSRLRDAGATVYRTDIFGTITCVSDGEKVSVSVERNERKTSAAGVSQTAAADGSKAPTGEASDTGDAGEYIGNKNTKVFHFADCFNLPDERNRVAFSSRDEAISHGYSPCGNCEP